MSEQKDLERILRAYTQKKNTSRISRHNLERYAAHWAGEFSKNRPGFTDFSTFTNSKYGSLLEKMESEGTVSLESSELGEQQVVYLRYYPYLIRKMYEEAEQTPDASFPSEDMLGENIPESILEVIEVKDQLVSLLGNIKEEKNSVFRFVFPEGVRSMIVIGETVADKLLPMCILKIRTYLGLQKNSEYVNNKMYGIFSKKEQSVKDLFANIKTQKDVALKTITDPDDFTFQFWTHLSSLVVGEYREKTNKLDREHGFSQAGYLIGLYALYYKGRKKLKLEKEQTYRHIEQSLKKAPYYHSFTDLYKMRDKLGLPISKKISQHELAQYLEKRSKKEKDGSLRDILRLVTSDKKEYYVSKEQLLTLILQRVQHFSREVRQQYINQWAEAMGQYKKLSTMARRDAFQNDLWRRIKEMDPLLDRLLQYEMVFLCLKETKPSREVYIEANRIIDEKQNTLIPIDEILRLDQRMMIRDARTYLPLWKSIPLFGRLGVFFSRLFTRLAKGASAIKDPSDVYASFAKGANNFSEPKTATAEAARVGVKQLGLEPQLKQKATSRAQEVGRKVEFKKAIYALRQSFIGPDRNIEEVLSELIEQWNPLVDPKAKQDLVEDVNSAVRDFLRKLKRNLLVKPPDEQRIHNLSAQVAEYDAFKRIKNKDAFRRYIEIYMLKVLSIR